MQLLDDIADAIPQDPACDSLTQLGDALDHAEFVERVPELQRENAVEIHRQYGRFAPYWATPDTFDDFLVIPDHEAVRAFRYALMFAPDTVPDIHAHNVRHYVPVAKTLQTARARFEAAMKDFYTRCHYRVSRSVVEWNDDGRSVSLREILNAQHAMGNAYRELEIVRPRAKRKQVRVNNKRELEYWRERLAV